MDSRVLRFFSVLALAILTSSFLFSEEIPNWTVPAYHGLSASGGLSTMTDISPGIAFVAMSPCRVFEQVYGAFGEVVSTAPGSAGVSSLRSSE